MRSQLFQFSTYLVLEFLSTQLVLVHPSRIDAVSLSRSSFLRFLRPVLRSTRSSIANTAQIQSPPNQMISYTRTILTSPAPDKHHTMLLHIMTLTGYIRRNNSPRAQPYSRGLPFCRIRFFRLRDPDFQTHAFEFWSIDVAEGWRDGFSYPLLFPAAFCDLVVG